MRQALTVLILTTMIVVSACTTVPKNSSDDPLSRQEKYADYVWPPPPDVARIRLLDILRNRFDVEPRSRIARSLTGTTAMKKSDFLIKPYGAVIDSEGRILVSDPSLGAIVRFDRENQRYDVFGVGGTVRLRQPMGLGIAADDTVYVADVGQQKVLSYTPDGFLKSVYGKRGQLSNPTDVAVGPLGERIFVTDSKAHKIVVFRIADGQLLTSFGTRGVGLGEFNFPSSLAFSPEGDLYVVDQINSRVQILTDNGEALESFGNLGTGYGSFVRPKGIAIDSSGLIFVSDAAFGNVQIFDIDLRLLTFIGEVGTSPGAFRIPGEVYSRDGRFVMVDQLNQRVQLFEFVENPGGS